MRIIQEIIGYFLLGAAGMVALAVPCLPVCFLLRKKIPVPRQIVYFLLGVCLIIILLATVLAGMGPSSVRSLNLIPFRMFTEPWIMGTEKKIAQIFANMLMFVPPAFFLPMAFHRVRSWWKTAALVAAFSFLIEFVQYFIGRSADVDDLILNTTGGILGYLLFRICEDRLEDKKWWKCFSGEVQVADGTDGRV